MRKVIAGISAIFLACGLGVLRADDPPARPALAELNRESQGIFQGISGSIVRLQMPLPARVAMELGQTPLDKWNGLMDPAALRRLEDSQRQAPSGTYLRVEIGPTTNPASTGLEAGGGAHIIYMRQTGFAPNCVGAVIDKDGDVLAPMYIDQESCRSRPVQVTLADGRAGTALFVASDEPTNLTVLKLQNLDAYPARLGSEPPTAGSLVLLISISPNQNRWTVWESAPSEAAAVVDCDGMLMGFTQRGEFVGGDSMQWIARRLIEHGPIQRALLGVRLGRVLPDDPQRQSAALGARPALRVLAIVPDSAAQKAGVASGDLILSLGGKAVGDLASFAAAIAQCGGSTPIQILRGNQVIELTADLQAK